VTAKFYNIKDKLFDEEEGLFHQLMAEWTPQEDGVHES